MQVKYGNWARNRCTAQLQSRNRSPSLASTGSARRAACSFDLHDDCAALGTCFNCVMSGNYLA